MALTISTNVLLKNLNGFPRKFYLPLLCCSSKYSASSAGTKKINKAVASYLKKAQEYDEFMKEQFSQYESGMKHLANMMGKKDHKMMTQEEVDEAIEYLLPSGLYVPAARPSMKSPDVVFMKQKPIQFDNAGRPFHFAFYTRCPNYTDMMHNAAAHLQKLNDYEGQILRKNPEATSPKAINLSGSEWLTKEELEKLCLERLFDVEYEKYLEAFKCLADHPYSYMVEDFIWSYRKKLKSFKELETVEPIALEDGSILIHINKATRDTAFAKVSLKSPGTGIVKINGQGIDYFTNVQCREQTLDMDLNFDKDFRRKRFGRSISFQKDLPVVEAAQKTRTATPSFLSKFKSFRADKTLMLQRSKHLDLEDSSSSALDDIIFLESFEEINPQEDINTIISRDGVRQNVIDTMKSGSGNVNLLNDIEIGNVHHRNVEEYFAGCTSFEKNVAFLWSVFLKRRDLLDFFFSQNVDVNFCEIQQGFGALHLSSFSGCNHCTGYLISKGANVNALSHKYTPLHCAAFGNSASTAKLLLNAGARIVPEKGCNETPIHSAVRSKAIECLRLFANENIDMNNMGECGFSPLHLAADLGHVQCLQVLLDSQKCDINLQSSERKCSSLHFAAENGFAECVKLLLEYGADVNSANYKQQTPLHAAAKVCFECVEILLKYGADPNSPDVDNRTPMHTAVCKSESEHSLEIINFLCMWKGDVSRRDKYGYTPLHIAALNELSECVECLILQGSDVTARTRGGTSALSIISRKTPVALGAINQKLDECLTTNDPDASKEIILMFNFRYLLSNCKRGEVSFLQTLVDEGQKEILSHPLCEAFLHLKWQKIRKYYITRLIFCLTYVILLSIYVLTALAYQCYNDSVSDVHPDVEARILIVDSELCTKKSYFGDLLRRNPVIMEVEWFVLAFITVLEVCRKVYGFRGYHSFRHYISHKGNIVEWFVVLSVFLISFIYTGRTYTWQNHVGALAVLCGWANVMVMIGTLPIFGSYVTMYTKVQKEFTKLFLAYICLLIGFTVCFCVIFPKAKQFSNPFIAIIKILVMMTGELEFDSLLENITQENSHPASLLEISALTTFVFFLLFVTIILMNLLIGIAVHDIQGLQKTAVLSKLVGQTKLITHIESALFNGCLPNCFLKLLQLTALISPSAYRVVVSVKPLNPRETRLPQEVMRSALEVAKQKRAKMVNTSARSSLRCTTFRKKKIVAEEDVLREVHASLAKLIEEVATIKRTLGDEGR